MHSIMPGRQLENQMEEQNELERALEQHHGTRLTSLLLMGKGHISCRCKVSSAIASNRNPHQRKHKLFTQPHSTPMWESNT